MLQKKIITLSLLLLLNLNSLIGQGIDSTKFSLAIDLAKLPTTFNLIKEESTNTYKNDICIRYRLNKTFFLSSNAGVFNTDRELIPSIEVAKKIAEAFEVSLDFLVGEGQNSSFDKKTLERIQDIQQLDDKTQSVLFNLIDTYLRDAKARIAYSS